MDDDFEQDISRAQAYLRGFFVEDERGILRQKFLPEGSAGAKECRAALARVLRSKRPLDRQLRDVLATMFDPSPEIGSVSGERALHVKFRKKPKNHMANTHQAWFVWERVKAGANAETAIREAMDQFGVTRERMYDLWKVYKPKFEAVWGPL